MSPQGLTTIPVADFHTLQAEVSRITGDGGGFIYRGYCAPKSETPDSPEALITGLERMCNDIDNNNLEQASKREIAIIREFRRRAHHYVRDLPGPENYFEWLALMQHHGAPTRFLDCTYSLHVAAHFALLHTSRSVGTDLAIWMLNARWCRDASSQLCTDAGKPALHLRTRPLLYDQEGSAAFQLLQGGLPPSVWPINPFRLNERLTYQSGVFLAPADVTKKFVSNLHAIPGHDSESNVVRFVMPRSQLGRLGRHLYDANVTDTTLFPGLDGFAKSLWVSARYLNFDHLMGLQSI